MVTAKLEDSGPTTTIIFFGFKIISRRVEAVYFSPYAYPDNEGREIVHEGQYHRVFTLTDWILKDDPNRTPKSAADKKLDLENLILSGGDNEGLFTLTFDSEDSTSAIPQTEIYTGKAKLSNIRSIGGDNTVVVNGDLEFWEDTIS